MDRGTWWATVQGSQSRTRLSDPHSSLILFHQSTQVSPPSLHHSRGLMKCRLLDHGRPPAEEQS